MDQINQVLEFWFGTLDSEGFADTETRTKWWQGSDELDLEIAHRFGDQINQALHHGLKDWKETSQGFLALILLLDQFTRNIFRGTEQAFAGDYRALKLCKAGLSQKLDMDLPIEQRIFFYMPLEHSEDIHDQELCARLIQSLINESPESKRSLLENYLEFAHQHLEIIQKFGRFPHRNEILKRENTEAEKSYLADDPARFGQ